MNNEQNLIKNFEKIENSIKDIKTGKYLFRRYRNTTPLKNITNINKLEENIINNNNIKNIFDSLDSDQDGFISINNLQLSKINNNILMELTPILTYLQKTNNKINFDEFKYYIYNNI